MSGYLDFPSAGYDSWKTSGPADIPESDPLLCDICTEPVEDGEGWDVEDGSGGTHLLCRSCYCVNFL